VRAYRLLFCIEGVAVAEKQRHNSHRKVAVTESLLQEY